MKTSPLVLAAAMAASLAATGIARADCQSDAAPLQQEMGERAKALQAAGQKQQKPEPQVLCQLFRAYTAAEAKWTKFLVDNKDWCQIPQQVADQAKANAKKAIAMRDKICQVAASGGTGDAGGPPKPPPQGSISSALGITTGYTVGQSEGKSGVFDTLNGNALKR